MKKQISQSIQQKERKIFLNHMNSWFSNFVIEALRTESIQDPKIIKNEFMGTLNNSKMKLPYLFQPKEIKIDYNFHYEHEVFSNDIFIYDLQDSDYKEVEYLIKGLKTLKHQSEKILIIITSIMTWARSSPKIKKEKTPEEIENEAEAGIQEESEEEDIPADDEKNEGGDNDNADGEDKFEKEPVKKILSFKDKDYVLRVPAKKYYHYKMIETLALSAANTNPMLKTYIICPGFIYGCGEEIFYEYFKMAWLQDPNKLPIAGDGKNFIPTIHILDLVNCIKRIIEKKPSLKYIFAIDKTKNKSLKNIIKSISKCVGNGQVEALDLAKEKIENIPNFNDFTINVKAKTSKIFEDVRGDDEEEEDFLKRTFKWHCEFGLPENGEKIRSEFITYRNLKAQKIFITGPPAAGKSFLAEKLSKLYNLPWLKINDLIEFSKTLNDELGEEIKAKIEELKDKMVEELENNKKRKKNDPPIDRNSLNVRIPDEFIYKLYKRKLKENIYRNRGYILDGYPRSFADAQGIFFDIDESKAEDDLERFILNKDLLPNNVILLDSVTDEFLKNRVKSMPEATHINSHYNEDGMNRRILAYKNNNESIKGDASVSDFFTSKNIDLLRIDAKLGENELNERIKIFLERNGPINNFQKFFEEEEKIHKQTFEQKLELEISKSAKETQENEFFDNQKQEEKEKFNKIKLEDLKERERILLEKKSQVLRNYLLDNVVPILSQGILEVCQKLPDDPVDYLAEFLFEKSMQVPFKDPSKHPQQQ